MAEIDKTTDTSPAAPTSQRCRCGEAKTVVLHVDGENMARLLTREIGRKLAGGEGVKQVPESKADIRTLLLKQIAEVDRAIREHSWQPEQLERLVEAQSTLIRDYLALC
ncbi:MAG: hypothetical protein IMW98_08595 [Firmicutes bacterium]|nr:hypothetical protein [Bacillota bacterium]MBE3590864.1 hypothetical protein [Bacillota bacterium]